MFVIKDEEGNQFEVEIIHDLPLSGKEWDVACFHTSKKQFKRRTYHTQCIISELFNAHYGVAILGWEDRFICNKIDGAKKAFQRAIKDFPRSTRKLFWQQYWEMEKQWV